MSDDDLIETNEDLSALPQEILDQQKAIDEQDLFLFYEEIDVESMAYKYLHALNQFRYNYQVST